MAEQKNIADNDFQPLQLEVEGGREESGDTIWASMGLCYSYNTRVKGKEKYPYKEVAPLALLLWRYHLPQVRTIVRIVYTEPHLDQVRILHSLGLLMHNV